MSFPPYGENPMNIKRPHGEFDDKSKMTVDVGPEYATLNWNGKKFEIQAESFGMGGDFNPEDVFKPDYEAKIEDFMPEGITLYRESLRALDDSAIDVKMTADIIKHFSDYFESQGLSVKVE